MARSIKITVLTVITIFMVDRGIGTYLSAKYESNHCLHAGGDLNAYLKGKKYDIVFVGSSRVNTMINPELISKNAINVSKPSKHLYYHAAVIDLMDQYKKLPKQLLVLNIEVEDAFTNTESRLIADVSYLKYYYNSNSFIKKLINKTGPLERYKYMFDSFRFNGENFTVFTNPIQGICEYPEKGYYPLPKGKDNRSRLMEGMKDMESLPVSSFNPEIVPIIAHVKNICVKNNVKLIILYGPNYKLPGVFLKGSQIFEKICKEMDLEFINFSTEYSETFRDAEMWYDHIHLNSEGAIKYSLLLKDELKKSTRKDRGIINQIQRPLPFVEF